MADTIIRVTAAVVPVSVAIAALLATLNSLSSRDSDKMRYIVPACLCAAAMWTLAAVAML